MIRNDGFTCPVCSRFWRTEDAYRRHLSEHSDQLQLAYIELAEAKVGRYNVMPLPETIVTKAGPHNDPSQSDHDTASNGRTEGGER